MSLEDHSLTRTMSCNCRRCRLSGLSEPVQPGRAIRAGPAGPGYPSRSSRVEPYTNPSRPSRAGPTGGQRLFSSTASESESQRTVRHAHRDCTVTGNRLRPGPGSSESESVEAMAPLNLVAGTRMGC